MLCLIVVIASVFVICHGEYLDLSHDLNNRTLHYPGQPSFDLDISIKRIISEESWIMVDTYSGGTHIGTHIDAPKHFWKTSWSLDEIPVERLIGRPAVVIDIREVASKNPDVTVSVDDIRNWESEHEPVPKGAVILLCSGWSTEKYPDPVQYAGSDTLDDPFGYHFPAFGIDAVQWLVDEREIYGLGVDTFSTDNPQAKFAVHMLTCKENIYALENLKDPCSVPAAGATLHVLPPKIVGASGGPVRVVATWNTNTSGANTLNSMSNGLFIVTGLVIFKAWL